MNSRERPCHKHSKLAYFTIYFNLKLRRLGKWTKTLMSCNFQDNEYFFKNFSPNFINLIQLQYVWLWCWSLSDHISPSAWFSQRQIVKFVWTECLSTIWQLLTSSACNFRIRHDFKNWIWIWECSFGYFQSQTILYSPKVSTRM